MAFQATSHTSHDAKKKLKHRIFRHMLAQELADRDHVTLEDGLAKVDSTFETDEKLEAAIYDSVAKTYGTDKADHIMKAFGDGSILKLLLENLPAIIQAILAIISVIPKG